MKYGAFDIIMHAVTRVELQTYDRKRKLDHNLTSRHQQVYAYLNEKGVVFAHQLLYDLTGKAWGTGNRTAKRWLALLANAGYLVRFEYHTERGLYPAYALGLEAARITGYGYYPIEPERALEIAVANEMAGYFGLQFAPALSATVLAGHAQGPGGELLAVWCPRRENFQAREVAGEIPVAAKGILVCAPTHELLEWARAITQGVRLPGYYTTDELSASQLLLDWTNKDGPEPIPAEF